MIRLRNITKVFKALGGNNKILDNISYDFIEGTIYAIVGASGSGKTTLLNIIGLLDFDYQGVYRINNTRVTKSNANDIRNNWISYVYQTPIMFDYLDCYSNINLPHYLNGDLVPKGLISSTLNHFNLNSYNDKNMLKYSGGEVQRVSFCRGILARKQILLLDEATSALDSKNKEIIRQELEQLKKNRIIIMVSHDLNYVNGIADVILTIEDGKIKEENVVEAPALPLKLNKNKPLKGDLAIKMGVSFIKANYKRTITFAMMLAGGLAGLCLSLSLCQGFLKYFESSIKKDVSNNVYLVSKKDESALTQKDLDYFRQKDLDYGLICDETKGVICDKETGSLLVGVFSQELGYLYFQVIFDSEINQPYLISRPLYEELGEIKHLTLLKDEKYIMIFSSKMMIEGKSYVIKTKDLSLFAFLFEETTSGKYLYLYSDEPIQVVGASSYIINHVYQSLYEPIENIVGGLKKGIIVFCGLSFIISLLGVMTISILDLLERKKQIGLLELQGWNYLDIIKVLSIEIVVRGSLTVIITFVSTTIGLVMMNSVFQTLLDAQDLVVSFNIKTMLIVMIIVFLSMIIVDILPFYSIFNNNINSNLHE